MCISVLHKASHMLYWRHLPWFGRLNMFNNLNRENINLHEETEVRLLWKMVWHIRRSWYSVQVSMYAGGWKGFHPASSTVPNAESAYRHTDLLERMWRHHPDCTVPSSGYSTNISCTSTSQLSEEIKVRSGIAEIIKWSTWMCKAHQLDHWFSLHKLDRGTAWQLHVSLTKKWYRIETWMNAGNVFLKGKFIIAVRQLFVPT
jgi:hypothetical protein